jgi:dephospho-CoA kinase
MPKPSFIVALTGGIGSGKSTIAGLFGQRGVHCIDTDAIAHAVTGPGGRALAPIRRVFGDGVFAAGGALDRALMRNRVFADAGARVALEEILHPMIREEVDGGIGSDAATRAPYVMLAVPLLFETMGYRGRFRRSLAVDCPVELQRRRVQQRSGLPAPEVDRILATQISRSLRLQLADDVISNPGDLARLAPQVALLHEHYQLIAKAETQGEWETTGFVNSPSIRHNSPSLPDPPCA